MIPAMAASGIRSQTLRTARFALALALLLGLAAGVVGHHDPFDPATSEVGASYSVASAATHAGSAAHVEASENERHAGCTACLLQRHAGLSAFAPAATYANRPVDRAALTAREFVVTDRTAGATRGRAPPLV